MINAQRAKDFLEAFHGSGMPEMPEWYLVMKLAEEAGEVIQAYLRMSEFSRKTGIKEDFAYELADLVLAAYILAHRTGVDLDAEIEKVFNNIMTRGFKSRD